jgi:FKBP-type peptidyl-prolyl cis-trans isomerase 2
MIVNSSHTVGKLRESKGRTMSAAKAGDTVQLHYTGKLEDGSTFDSSAKREPLEVTLGQNRVIPGFEEAIIGMLPGDEKTVKVPPEKAYGDRREDLVVDFERSRVPSEVDVQLGKSLNLQTQSGQSVAAQVIDVNDDVIKLDANHPLAGQDLTFDIQLLAIIAVA